MGLIRSSFSFFLGTVCGIYIAQNYSVPNVTSLVNTYLYRAKRIEETYRKPTPDGKIGDKDKDDDFYPRR